MSLMPYVIREPDRRDVTTAEYVIYASFIAHLEQDRTSPIRAVLRAASDCGVSRKRVKDIIDKLNPPAL